MALFFLPALTQYISDFRLLNFVILILLLNHLATGDS